MIITKDEQEYHYWYTNIGTEIGISDVMKGRAKIDIIGTELKRIGINLISKQDIDSGGRIHIQTYNNQHYL